MNKTFYILFFIFTAALCNAQTNLVYNGDFELYDTCPVYVSSPWDYQIETCLGWKSPTYATSDYFNTCAVGTIVAVPASLNSYPQYQWPYSGNAYCGIYINYGVIPPGSFDGWWFEYLQSKLIYPLKAGYEYEFSCRVVLSTNEWDYAFWKFGAHFSQTAISKPDGGAFTGIIPQVINSANNFITDTLNWVEIKGKFIAQGAEEYITLGFFSDVTAPDTLRLMNGGFPVNPSFYESYYFVDACTLTETSKEPIYPNVFTPNSDGENDEWNPILNKNETIEIYNRWGIKVFELSQTNQYWDGRTTSGQECVNGVYYFIVLNKDEKNDTTKKGFIQLVR